ncbi:uncharacterized protein LOC126980853 [Eriocheir sinensis]|uniref:uncharacterized protein LOC126980853 n=1 Tax=Eriocheir sinensis TaxID=95602 RepID=UPI0021CA3C11|nr:uncharacterized protein LOC126980853 [Eriocheir sinensis]
MRVCMWAAVLVLAVAGVGMVAPQGVGVRLTNNTLFTAGLGLLVAGLAFQAGRTSAYHYYNRNGGKNPGGGTPGGFFPFRHRRHARDAPLDPRVERIFEAALEHDASGCVLELTCAIGRIPEPSLNGRVKDFHAILSSAAVGSAVRRQGHQGGLAEYLAARDLGRGGGDCDRLFPRCPTPSAVLLDQFQTMKVMEYRR